MTGDRLTDIDRANLLERAIAQAYPDSVIVGFVVVADVIPAEGERELVAACSQDTPSYILDGYLHEALVMDWDDESDA